MIGPFSMCCALIGGTCSRIETLGLTVQELRLIKRQQLRLGVKGGGGDKWEGLKGNLYI